MSCGGSSEMRFPISSGGCGGSTSYLYVRNSPSRCGGSTTSFYVDSDGCGGKVPASADDIRRALEQNRRKNWW